MKSSCTSAPSGSCRGRCRCRRPSRRIRPGNALYLQDVVGADDTMQEDLEGREDQRLIRRLVGECLTDREADVIRRRYGLDGHPPQTQRQVAAAYGISRSYVSRIEKRALEKLEAALREHCYP